MGYFDALTSSSFKITQDGRRLFFPWGTLSSGYAVPSEENFERLRRSVKAYMVISLSLISLAVTWQGFPEDRLPPELRDANPLGILRLIVPVGRAIEVAIPASITDLQHLVWEDEDEDYAEKDSIRLVSRAELAEVIAASDVLFNF